LPLKDLLRPNPRSGCTAETKACEFWRVGGDYVRPECCTAHLVELAHFAGELLERHGITHWLDFGTLLGAVRDGEMIPWDYDVDIGMLDTQTEQLLGLSNEIEAAGHHLVRVPGCIMLSYSAVNSLSVDIWPWILRDDCLEITHPDPITWPGMADRLAFPLRYLERPETVSLYGRGFPAPSPVGRFLSEHRYGPDYMRPRRAILNAALYPNVGSGELTPTVDDLIARIGAGERRLATALRRSLGTRYKLGRIWVNSGLPVSVDDDRVQTLRAELADEGPDAILDSLCRSVALLEQAIDEVENPRPALVVHRVHRRLVRGREATAALLTRRQHRAGFPFGS
jgi:hypothetical protein